MTKKNPFRWKVNAAPSFHPAAVGSSHIDVFNGVNGSQK